MVHYGVLYVAEAPVFKSLSQVAEEKRSKNKIGERVIVCVKRRCVCSLIQVRPSEGVMNKSKLHLH